MQVNWQRFVLQASRGMPASYLAAIVGQPEAEVRRLRGGGVVGSRPSVPELEAFVQLFTQWHGHPPRNEDWPRPRRAGMGGYQWLPPEDELLASLVGRMDKQAISEALTARLREITGDPEAERNAMSVQIRMNKIGLRTTDVVGGLTVEEAGAEVGSTTIVRNAIRSGGLKTLRQGRLLVIPHAEWSNWKASRTIAPPGFVPLASIRVPLGISSDSKLPEFASLGYIPTAVRCNPARPGVHTGQFGTWYVSPEVARRLVADRRAGRPMPWHGKVLPINARMTFKKWVKRKHPIHCETCRKIWGVAGAPKDFDAFLKQYPPLAHGAKRHLTMPWSEGLTPRQVATQSGSPYYQVIAAIRNGALRAKTVGRSYRITQTDATKWISRKKPSGDGPASWISMPNAVAWYDFSKAELQAFVSEGRVRARNEKGKVLLLRQQVAELRQEIGYSEARAAAKVGVSISGLRELLKGVHWRKEGTIPLVTVQAVIKRLQSKHGYTVAEAAKATRKPVAWVRDRIKDGTIRVTRTAWDCRRVYLTAPMLARLQAAKKAPAQPSRAPSSTWISRDQAARLAGVSTATVRRWCLEGEVRTQPTTRGQDARYARVSVMARTRRYWQTSRSKRPRIPEWLRAEWAAKGQG